MVLFTSSAAAVEKPGIYFPPPGESMAEQSRKQPEEVGMDPQFITQINERTQGPPEADWALWRHGYLIHVYGDFNKNTEVASLRKTWHALTVGAAIGQGRIPSVHQKISVWRKELTDKNAEATWWHVITQTSGFSVPKGPSSNGMPHIIESSIESPNPLVGSVESFAKWATIEIAFRGPKSKGRGEPNPFAISFDVIFGGPGGKEYRVPGFYDGDGRGGLDGDVWKVRFSADETGRWKYVSSSDHRRLDGHSGAFIIAEPSENAPAFYRWGRLEYTGTAENKIRYLKFRDGPYWLKAGCDDPENFLGDYKNYNTTEKRKAAVDYLAARGINSIYIMTHNLDGDDRDVWPWLGDMQRQAKANGGENARFDIAELSRWRELFEYMQTEGVVPYIVLEDDSAWKGYDHARYYREMIARFGDLPALLLNFNEEHNENYKLTEALEFMRLLEQIDPYDHPRGIHNVNNPNDQYVDAPEVDFTSIQTGAAGKLSGLDKALEHHKTTLDWIERCRNRSRRILVVNFDEGRPEEDRHAWWSAYLAGGVWEAHVNKPYDRPMSAWEQVWTQLGGTRAFMESLPFWEMESRDEVVKAGKAFCLAKPGEVYALYLPLAGSVTVSLPADGEFDVAWWNPANGRDGLFQNRARVNGGVRRFTPPDGGDWALRIQRSENAKIKN
jgi:hypothetical protein